MWCVLGIKLNAYLMVIKSGLAMVVSLVGMVWLCVWCVALMVVQQSVYVYKYPMNVVV